MTRKNYSFTETSLISNLAEAEQKFFGLPKKHFDKFVKTIFHVSKRTFRAVLSKVSTVSILIGRWKAKIPKWLLQLRSACREEFIAK